MLHIDIVNSEVNTWTQRSTSLGKTTIILQLRFK